VQLNKAMLSWWAMGISASRQRHGQLSRGNNTSETTQIPQHKFVLSLSPLSLEQRQSTQCCGIYLVLHPCYHTSILAVHSGTSCSWLYRASAYVSPLSAPFNPDIVQGSGSREITFSQRSQSQPQPLATVLCVPISSLLLPSDHDHLLWMHPL
jgi:hypothetical protein